MPWPRFAQGTVVWILLLKSLDCGLAQLGGSCGIESTIPSDALRGSSGQFLEKDAGCQESTGLVGVATILFIELPEQVRVGCVDMRERIADRGEEQAIGLGCL